MRRLLRLLPVLVLLTSWVVAQDAAPKSALPDPDALVAAVEAAEKQGPVALDQAVGLLGKDRFTVDSALVKVAVVEFDELARKVIVQVDSLDPAVPLSGRFRLDLKLSYAPETTWRQLRQAIKDRQLKGTIVWRLARTAPRVYLTQVSAVVVGDTATIAVDDRPLPRWAFVAGKRKTPQKASLVEAKAVPGSSTLSAFLMTTVPVTQEQFETLLGRTPSTENHPEWSANHPVQNLRWMEAVEFANRLSVVDGLQPVYTVAGDVVWPDYTRSGWRLPTAAEWDWARHAAGKSTSLWAGSPTPDDVAWIKLPTAKTALDGHSVATKKPNELGLYDLTGNVQIWIEDRPGFTAAAPTSYVGASYRNLASELVEGSSPGQTLFGDKFRDRGFRLVRTAPGAKVAPRPPYPATAAQLITAYETADPDLDDRAGLEAALRTSRWTVAPTALAVSLSEFDRTLKQWTATIRSTEAAIPGTFTVGLSLKGSLDLPADFRAITAANASRSLQARLQWGLRRATEGTYRGMVLSLEFGQTLAGGFQVLQTVQPLVDWEFRLDRSEVRTSVPVIHAVRVPGGTFRLGGQRLMPMSLARSDNSEHLEPEVEHPVTVSDFWMMPEPVTQEVYLRLMNTNPSRRAVSQDGKPLAVDSVSWYDAVEFANRLSLAMGLEPAYDLGPRSEFIVTLEEFKTVPVVTLNPQRNGWRLPSSAEFVWARKGKPQGEVAEWMGDNFAGYRNAPAVDPFGPATSDEAPGVKDIRGGSYRGLPYDVQFRQTGRPDTSGAELGFRLVRRGPALVPASWTGPVVPVAPIVQPKFTADPQQGYRLVNVGKTNAMTLGISLLSDRDPVFFSDARQARGVFHVTPVNGGYRFANDALGPKSNIIYLDTMTNSVGYFPAVEDAEFPWVPEPLADGSFRLASTVHGPKLYLEARDNGRGADLVITSKSRTPLQQWKLVPTGSTASTASPSLWAINSNGNIFRRQNDSWSAIAGSGTRIAAGGGSVWMLGTGLDLEKWDGSQFVKVPAASGRQVSLAVDPQGRPWAVSLLGGLAMFDGTRWVPQPKIGGRFYEVAVGPGGEVWVLGGAVGAAGAEIFQLVSGAWTKVPGEAVRVTVGTDGKPWVTNKAGQIFRWDGKTWRTQAGAAQSVTAGASGAVWSVGGEESPGGFTVLRWLDGDWEVIDGGVTDLAAE